MSADADLADDRRPGSPPAWTQALFAAPLTSHLAAQDGQPLVWAVEDRRSQASISEQFTVNAGDYHHRYAAADHFEALFRAALSATGIAVAPAPLILDIGSGSGVNSVVPCQRLFPGARIVATDLSGELLALLGGYVRDRSETDSVVCVKMDAMSARVTKKAFDLVTGAAILHHLLRPKAGLDAAANALKPGGHAIFFEPFDGWGLLRFAFSRILAESALRADPLDPAVAAALEATIRDVAARSAPDPNAPGFAALDDKWLFSRARMEAWAKGAGFREVRFVPHGDHPSLYRDTAFVQLRLMTGHEELALPDWAIAILDDLDASMTWDARRELMLEGTVVLTR